MMECGFQPTKSVAEFLAHLPMLLQPEKNPGEMLPAFKNYTWDTHVLF